MNGITLNHLEHLLGSDGEPKIFETEEKAKECLRKYGWTDNDMSHLVFEQTGLGSEKYTQMTIYDFPEVLP